MARAPVGLIALLCASFVAIGAGVATLGPALPGLARATQRPLPDLGALLSALFAGMLVGQATAGALVDRYGVRPPMLVSFVAYAVGVFSLPLFTAFGGLLSGGLLMGVGFGMASISCNSLASRLIPTRPGFVLNLINVWYAVGSVAGPFLASLWLARGGEAADLLLVIGAGLLALVPLAWLWAPKREVTAVAPKTPGVRVAQRPWRPSLALLLIGVVVLLYGGVEAGFGGWVASYVQQTIAVTAARAALLTSLFWLSYLFGRIAATVATLSVRPGYVLVATIGVVATGGVLLGLGHGDLTLTVTGIAVLGFGVGPVYPAMFALVTQRFAERPATAVSVTSSIGSLGAIVLPWVMGQALPIADGLVVAWMPAGLGLGMLLVVWLSEVAYRRERRDRTVALAE